MICPYCGEKARWCENKEIYGKNYGKSYMCYYCKPCNAYVGCHRNTRMALGTIANAELRGWRQKAHRIVDPLWKSGKMKRAEVYQMLSRHFGHEIHIGESNIQICKQIINFITK